ncbi:hypothetical protein RB195_003423 [Necator americanus]|uniref:Phosphotransferase n=1 Tax=Necator americanus TaxID=51031 RepID=A0ABR1DNJ0_NECAM
MSLDSGQCQVLVDVYRSVLKWLLSLAEPPKRAVTGFDASEINKDVLEACKPMILSDEQLRGVMAALHDGMEKGLRKGTPPGVGLKMLPSYIRGIPDGTEYGDYLALDLGGTNFRVLLIRLKGHEAEMVGKVYAIPTSIQQGKGEELFDHIASCMAMFSEEQFGKGSKKRLPLGFTFSFATNIIGLTKGILIHWSKGFCASGVEGKDVVQLLRKACKKRSDVDIDVVAILNDTVGTLMACAFKERSCQMGVILGTGTNACYMEKLQNVHKLKGEWENDGQPDEMIINMEWGAFGDDGCLSFIYTDYDREIDKKSINPNKHLFEKMISGMYMGELVRIILELLARKGALFNGDYAAISKRECFTTKHVSEVETELESGGKGKSFPKTREILSEIGVSRVTDEDCHHVAYVCAVVSTRAAHLTGSTIAQVLNRMKRPYKVTVGVDGSVYRFHPSFKRILNEKISHLIDKNVDYQLMLSADGSGIGAAVVAAVATRIKRSRSDKTVTKIGVDLSSLQANVSAQSPSSEPGK